jgi:hypothetical protein
MEPTASWCGDWMWGIISNVHGYKLPPLDLWIKDISEKDRYFMKY